MTTAPPDGLPKLVKAEEVATPLADLLQEFHRQQDEFRTLDIHGAQENTRGQVTLLVVRTFSIFVMLMACAATAIALFGDVGRLEALAKVALAISGIVSPVVTFIFGYYFATKPRD